MTIDLATRAAWRSHPNISGPAGTLLSIHGQFRVASERLSLLVERDRELGWVGRAFSPLAQTLHHHHHAEEQLLFPFVERQTERAPSQLVTDHEALTRAIAEVEEALSTGADPVRAREAIRAFAVVLHEHLDREELLVIPILLTLSPREGWALLHGG